MAHKSFSCISFQFNPLSCILQLRVLFTLLVFVFSIVIVLTAIVFTSANTRTFSNRPKSERLEHILRSNVILLRPQLAGRLGNQMFEWASAWGIAQQLRAAFNYTRHVSVVVDSTKALYA